MGALCHFAMNTPILEVSQLWGEMGGRGWRIDFHMHCFLCGNQQKQKAHHFSPKLGCVLVFMAAITEHHRLGGTNSKNLFFHSSGGWKSKIKVPTGLVSSGLHKKSSFCRSDGHRFGVSSHGCPPMCSHAWSLFLFLYRHHFYWIGTPPLRTHLTLPS